MVEKTFITSTPFHAKPITELVNATSQFVSEASFTYQGKTVDLKSIMGVLSLAVPNGAEVTISFEGADEEQALRSLEEILEQIKVQ